VAILRRVVPGRTAGQIIDELSEDYTTRRLADRRGSALWLARETLSIVGAFLLAGMRARARRSALVGRDLRHAWRLVCRHPVQSIAAASMLGCGIAVTATVTGLAGTLLVRPISAQHGERLRRLAAVDREGGLSLRFSYAELELIRTAIGDDATLAAVDLQPVVIRRGAEHWQAIGEVVTAGYFDVVSQRAVAGRPLLTADDRQGAPAVAVIGSTTWRDRFRGRESVVGAEIVVNSTPFTIVGVMESRGSPSFASAAVDVWIPSAHGHAMLNPGWRTDPLNRWWTPLILASPGSMADLDRRLGTAMADLLQLAPQHWENRVLVLQPGLALLGNQRTTAATLVGVLGALALLMLAVAGANVSGLWLATAAADRRQMAVHLALGAGRTALVGRRVVSGALVGVCAGTLALAGYTWARVALAAIALQPAVTLRLDLPLDLRTAMLIVVAGAAAGGLLAIGPAAWAAGFNLSESLQGGAARSVTTMPAVRRLLVAAQVALSLTLMIGATAFSQGAERLAELDAGFPRQGLVAMDFDVEPAVEDAGSAAMLARQALDQVRRLPAITASAMANRAPVDPSTPRTSFRRAGDSIALGSATLATITDGYFETVGIPILSGRAFSIDEIERSAEVAVVNQALASRLWPDGDVLNRALVLDAEPRSLRIVGIARDARYRSLSEAPGPLVYVPRPPDFRLALLARTTGDPRRALSDIQAALDRVGPGVVGFFPRTMEDHLALELLPYRAAANASSILGAAALVLSATGLYALVAWFVEVRRREIGVRLALGATPRRVGRLVLGEALRTAVPGAMTGLVVAWGLVTLAGSALAGVTLQPAAAVAGLASTIALVIVATYGPWRRAVGVDPAQSLRDN
jgi:predicted permease